MTESNKSSEKNNAPKKAEQKPDVAKISRGIMGTRPLGTQSLRPLDGDKEQPIPGPSLKNRIKKLVEEQASLTEQAPPPPEPDPAAPTQQPSAMPSAPAEAPAPVSQSAPSAPKSKVRSVLERTVLSPQIRPQAKKPAQAAPGPAAPDEMKPPSISPTQIPPGKKAQALQVEPLTDSDLQPRTSGQVPPDEQEGHWQVIFQPVKGEGKTLGLLADRVCIIGRQDPDKPAHLDLDLTHHNGEALGVSRQHAILMPSPQGLWLVDLDSTNGTWVNGLYLKPGYKYRIRSGDRVEFGNLEMVMRILGAHPQSLSGAGDDPHSTMISRSKPGKKTGS